MISRTVRDESSAETTVLSVFDGFCLFPHRHTHELKLHQLLVRVCGWEQVKPVSVDKVGIFFRYAAPDRNSSSSTVSTDRLWERNTHLMVPAHPFVLNGPQVGSPISRTNIIHPHVYVSLFLCSLKVSFWFKLQ